MLKEILSRKAFKIIISIIILAATGYGGYIYYLNQTTPATTQGPTYSEQRVSRGDVVISFAGDGTADIPVTNLDFQVSGKLKNLYVHEGDTIRKGQVVATLDDTDYVNKLNQARNSYNQAVTKLASTKQNHELNLITEKQKLDNLNIQLRKLSEQYLPMVAAAKDGIYSIQEVQQKKDDYDSAKMAVNQQQERYNILLKNTTDIQIDQVNLEAQRIALKTAQDDLNNTILKSPINAKVLLISYKPGETVKTFTGSTVVATADSGHTMVVTDAKNPEITVPVAEVDLENVSVGQPVEVTFEALKGQVFRGKVVSINALPIIDSSGLVTYKATIDLNEGMDRIKSGMTCSVSFILAERRNVMVLPNKAVTMENGKQIVKVKDDNGKITSAKVTTGLTDGTNVEVSKGLKPGDNVLVQQ